MKKTSYHLPITASSVMLGLASLGNLLAAQSIYLKIFFGSWSLIFLLLILTKFIHHLDTVHEELKNSAIFSTFVTFTAGCMVLASYFNHLLFVPMEIIWYSMIVIQFIIMGIFTYLLIIKNFDYQKIVPGWLVTYVGIGIVGVTAPAFENYFIGGAVTIFAACTYFMLLPLVLKRTFFDRNLEHPTLATICIFPAPANLILIGYLNCFPDYNLYIVYGLWILGFSFYFLAIWVARRFVFGQFYPSLAALTFPFVVCATATQLVMVKVPHPEFFKYLYVIQLLISIFFVVSVAYRFLKYSLTHRNNELV